MWSVHRYWDENKWDTVDFLNYAASINLKGVELLSVLWRNQTEELPQVMEALEKHQIKVSCYSASNNFVSTDSKIRQEQLKEVTDSIDMAVYLSAPVVRVFSGEITEDNVTYEQGLDYVIDGLTKAAQYAESKGVTLCLENHGLFAGRSDQVIDIIRKVGSPALRSTFDTGNFLLVGQDPNDAIDHLKDYVKHVHIKDFQKVSADEDKEVYKALNGENFQGKIPGEGEVDLHYVLSKIKSTGYDGWISVEFEGIEDPKEGSTCSVEYVNQLLESIR